MKTIWVMVIKRMFRYISNAINLQGQDIIMTVLSLQVRAVSNEVAGEWSEEISLGKIITLNFINLSDPKVSKHYRFPNDLISLYTINALLV